MTQARIDELKDYIGWKQKQIDAVKAIYGDGVQPESAADEIMGHYLAINSAEKKIAALEAAE